MFKMKKKKIRKITLFLFLLNCKKQQTARRESCYGDEQTSRSGFLSFKQSNSLHALPEGFSLVAFLFHLLAVSLHTSFMLLSITMSTRNSSQCNKSAFIIFLSLGFWVKVVFSFCCFCFVS